MYLHDNQRSGATATTLELPLTLKWVFINRHAPQPAWPLPAKGNPWGNQTNLPPRVTYDWAYHVVASAGRVYFGSSSEDAVVCLDLKTGRQQWRFYTEGPVRFAPTLADGRVFFGSDDGYVYSLDGANGRLLWKYRAAPEDRRIPGNGRMISAWPVRSDVMLVGGALRATCGLFPSEGTYQFALDPATGRELARQALKISPQGYLEERGKQLFFCSGRAGLAFATEPARTGLGALGPNKQNKTPAVAAAIAAGNARFLGRDGSVAALDPKSGKEIWSAKVKGRAESLAVADGVLLVSTTDGEVSCFAPGKDRATTTAPAPISWTAKKREAQRLASEDARKILEASGLKRGYCLVIGAGDGWLVRELARQSELSVIGVEPDPILAAEARSLLDSDGLYGRTAVHCIAPKKLPYGDELFNLIVDAAAFRKGELPGNLDELARVVRPAGGMVAFCPGVGQKRQSDEAVSNWMAQLKAARGQRDVESLFALVRPHGWGVLRCGKLVDDGEWTHLYANSGNTAASEDPYIGTRLQLQWFGPPGPRNMVDRHHRAMSPMYQNGRLFVPGDDVVFGVDAYNGTPLWESAVPGSRRIGVGRDCGSMALGNDWLYIAAGNRCVVLDVETGRTKTTFDVPSDGEGSPRDWGYVAVVGDKLYGSATASGASRQKIARDVIQEAYQDGFPLVTSRELFALDRQTGKTLWRYNKPTGAIINPTIALAGDRLLLVESEEPKTLAAAEGRATLKALLAKGASLVSLDAETGRLLWRVPMPLELVQHDLYLIVRGDIALLGGSGNTSGPGKPRLVRYLAAHDVATGRQLWSRTIPTALELNGFHGEQTLRPTVIGETVYLEPDAWQLQTGEPVRGWKVPARRGGCGLMAGSRQAMYFRDGTTALYDVRTGQRHVVSDVSRPGCWINAIPAGGLLLVPEGSSGCTCDIPIQTSLALRPRPTAAPAAAP